MAFSISSSGRASSSGTQSSSSRSPCAQSQAPQALRSTCASQETASSLRQPLRDLALQVAGATPRHCIPRLSGTAAQQVPAAGRWCTSLVTRQTGLWRRAWPARTVRQTSQPSETARVVWEPKPQAGLTCLGKHGLRRLLRDVLRQHGRVLERVVQHDGVPDPDVLRDSNTRVVVPRMKSSTND